MELIQFSVTNYRSITKAHKIPVSESTVLIGKNNEGKSNLLRALNVAMTSILSHSAYKKDRLIRSKIATRNDERIYYWDRDFPITLQGRKSSGTQTIIRLEFRLDESEIAEFKSTIRSSLNGSLPIEIKIGKDSVPIIAVVKKGKGSNNLNTKSAAITDFIASKIIFNYIPAVRTEQEAMNVVSRMIEKQLSILDDDPEYIKAQQIIRDLQQPIMDKLGEQVKIPLQEFLPNINDVKILINDETRRISMRRDFDIIVDDGTPTNLAYKGDGVKSLVALSLLKNRIRSDGASIIAIEEPESHLHPAAIHQLVGVINLIAEENQVILSTHNPLFVDRQKIKSNVIINDGEAFSARSIKQIRELLGIKASDNLVNASYVLVVEGMSDAVVMTAILSDLSEKIKKNISTNMLIIDTLNGAGKLSYKLSLLKNSLCLYHCLLDNDESGRNAYEDCSDDGLLSLKSTTFITCSGMTNSELEDCINVDIYKDEVKEKYGVHLDIPLFKSSKKWSERIKEVFKAQGKIVNNKIEDELKTIVATSVAANPKSALNPHRRGAIDSLLESIEDMIP